MSKKVFSKHMGSYYDLDGSKLTNIISDFQKLVDKHGPSTTLSIDDTYDNYKEYNIYVEVMETDEEYSYRLEREDKEIKRKQERELEELARLKAKYGEK